MDGLIFAALVTGAGLGCWLVIQGLRGKQILGELTGSNRRTPSSDTVAWAAAGLVAAVVVLAVTGWPVAALAALVAVAATPRIRAGRSGRSDEIARTQAIATWTEMIRDNMAGAAGLEQALVATGPVAPSAIAPEVRRFVHRIDDTGLLDALVRLGDDLNHPSSDLVVSALANAVRMESRDLGPLLSRLADSIRGDVRMRLRVEVGRTRIRTSARIVTAVTCFTVVFLYVFSRPLLDVYDTPIGQLWLLVVLSTFGLGAWLMDRYSRIETPERFTARHRTTATEGSRR